MFTKGRLCGAWCLLSVTALFISCSPVWDWMDGVVARYDSSTWFQFILYGGVTAIPVAAWTRKSRVFMCLGVTMLTSVWELLRVYLSAQIDPTRGITVHLFGAAAGILLGLNIRMMHRAAHARQQVNHVVPQRTCAAVGRRRNVRIAAWSMDASEAFTRGDRANLSAK